MKAICARLDNPAGCSISAQFFYTGVKEVGESAFKSGLKYAENNCGIKLPPPRPPKPPQIIDHVR